MFSKINGFSTRGIDGYRITVEVDVSDGLPRFCYGGLPGGGGAGGAGARSDCTSECGGLPAALSGSRSIYRQPECGKRERGVIWRSRQEF